MTFSKKNVCVVGAGVVGLTTALELQSAGLEVTLIADKFDHETTSDGAAGIFRPAVNFSGASPEFAKTWIITSYRHYKGLLKENCGISEISGYVFAKSDPSIVRNHFLEELLPYRNVTTEELSLCPGDWKYGSYFTTLLIECRTYLPWMKKRFVSNGGRIIKAKLKRFYDIKDLVDCIVIVNCTGLGAKTLCNDHSMVPISGQVYKVEAPWLDKFYYGEYDTYVIPGKSSVTLGGSRKYDSSSTELSKYTSADIWHKCTSLVPSLKKANVIREWIGLRPHRDGGVRVEAEVLSDGTMVVHNYGHGGYGVTSAPGTSKHAVTLVLGLLSSSKL